MVVRRAFLASLLAVACLAAACSSSNSMATPTSPGLADGRDAAQNREGPPTDRGRNPAPPASGRCNDTAARFAIGQRATADLLESARSAAGASTARFLRPNQPITTEYIGSRLNLDLNTQDIVRAVSCG